jgi:hypothetical protein
MAATKQTGTGKTGTAASRKMDALVKDAEANKKTLVRLKPHNPKKGAWMRKYTAFGVLFEVDKGWYQVDEHVAKYLKTVHAKPDDPDCATMAFDVVSPAEAQKIAERETDLALEEGRPVPRGARKVIPRDVTTGTDMGPKPENMPPKGFDLSRDDLGIPRRAPEPRERSMRAADE